MGGYLGNILTIHTELPWATNRSRGNEVARVYGGKGEWRIGIIKDNAPNYLKKLEGKEFEGKPVLETAVRREAFLHLARQLLRDYLLAEEKERETLRLGLDALGKK